MVYRCEPQGADQLVCDFEQSAVRLKAKIAELPAAIEAARKQFRDEKPPSEKECTMYRDIDAVMNGQRPAPKPEALKAMTSVEKADFKLAATAYLNYCSKPSEDNYLDLVRIDHEKKRRTCLVSVHAFQQSFKLVRGGSNQATWVTQGQPEGPCGVVQLSRFEPEEIAIGKSKYTNWKYIARKAISNPTGELVPGAKCSGLDESTYTYDWRAKEHQQTCDYIEFSPLRPTKQA